METFSRWIEDSLKARNWKPADLARVAGITDATLSRILNGTRNPGPDFCRAIARALSEPEEKIFRLAGLLSPLPASDDSTLAEIQDLAKNLPPSQRKEALRYLRYLYQSGHTKMENNE